VAHDVRDEVVDFVNRWSSRAELAVKQMVSWLGVSSSKFYDWRGRYGKVNEHNAWVPRDHWLEDWERQRILDFERQHPREGYRRLAFMMLDQDVVAVSPTSVYRVLKQAGRLQRWNRKPSRKGTGFEHPLRAHEHWHVDVSYINVCGTFYYLCSLLDGYSRYIVHWEIRESMTEADVEIVLQGAKEKFPTAAPRVISDNGPQFIAKDFKEFIRICGMTHVRTSPYYPQSNGKLERWHKSLKSECIRPGTPLSLEDARRLVAGYVEHYNTARLHSAIGYVTPADKLAGREALICAERDRKLDEARRRRQAKRAAARHMLATTAAERENGDQPVKRKRALEASNPPGITGRVCDEWSRGGSNAAPHPHHSEHSPMPQKTQASDGGMCKARDLTLQFRLNQHKPKRT
jgi:transposase InsO family protein